MPTGVLLEIFFPWGPKKPAGGFLIVFHYFHKKTCLLGYFTGNYSFIWCTMGPIMLFAEPTFRFKEFKE